MIIIISSLVVILMRLRGNWFLVERSFYLIAFIFLKTFLGQIVRREFLSFEIGVDFISYLIIILSLVIGGLIIRGSYKIKHSNRNSLFFIFLVGIIVFMLIQLFITKSPIYFYIYFEVVLIPIFLIIMGWGYQPERLQARIYILFYTLFASLPLLFLILLSYEFFRDFYFLTNKINTGRDLLINLLVLIFLAAFLVKLPIYCLHLWLPKAHVEAPVSGSMILAGVLLKLGRYGMWRFASYIYIGIKNLRRRLVVIGLLGGLIVRFVCRVQVDIKSLVAFSSVVHIGILLAGMATLIGWGYQGALCLIIGHGLVSSRIFYLVGVVYDRIGTRRILINKGIIILFPSLTIFWFLRRIYNIRAPPSINLLGEILLTLRILKWRWLTFLYLILINFIGIVYTFYLYTKSQQGKASEYFIRMRNINLREYNVILVHLIIVSLNVLFFWIY